MTAERPWLAHGGQPSPSAQAEQRPASPQAGLAATSFLRLPHQRIAVSAVRTGCAGGGSVCGAAPSMRAATAPRRVPG